jgi:SAM-dependent methyltransferase
MREYLAVNRALWDGWTKIHAGSAFYDVEGFRAGALTLKPLELERVGSVAGKNLLHLQCHFGLDTLSWARLGARVTGVDFSHAAIRLAQSLAAEQKLDAQFVCADASEVPLRSGQFDIVYTSYGVLPWLADLGRWAANAARCLRSGGVLHLIEFHPLAAMLGEDGRSIVLPYFEADEPARYRVRGSYADPAAPFEHDSYEWAHSLSETLGALSEAGLRLTSFTEYAYSPYNCFPFLEEVGPDRWAVRDRQVEIPLTFAVTAVKANGK